MKCSVRNGPEIMQEGRLAKLLSKKTGHPKNPYYRNSGVSLIKGRKTGLPRIWQIPAERSQVHRNHYSNRDMKQDHRLRQVRNRVQMSGVSKHSTIKQGLTLIRVGSCLDFVLAWRREELLTHLC